MERDKKAERERVRIYHYKKKYGLTVDDYNNMLFNQHGGCAICHREPLEGNVLHIDHCHVTGKIRGLLCGNCNHLLGNAGDDINLLNLAIIYLKKKRY